MSDTTEADSQTHAGSSSRLGRALDLTDDEVKALGLLFAEATRSMGIDGGPIFDRLVKGESLGRALSLPPGLGELLYARAHRWFSVGRADRAEPLFRALCILDDQSADHWVGYGICLRLRDNFEQARLAFETAARMRPDWAVPHFHALELAVRQRDWARADVCLQTYDRHAAADDLPEAIRSEVERLRAAIRLRRGENS